MLPDKFDLFVSGLGDEELYREHVTYWSDVYGFRMSCMRSEVVKEASLTVVPDDSLITTPHCIQVCS